jgi:hypothetical protein
MYNEVYFMMNHKLELNLLPKSLDDHIFNK